MKIKLQKISLIFPAFFLGIFLIPHGVSALSVYVEKPIYEVREGDVVSFSVFLDTEEKEINSLDGKVVINGPVQISAVSTGGSIFSFWPIKPSVDGNIITFTGGSISGVSGGKLKLFSVSLMPTASGSISFHSKEVIGYMADGYGTKINGVQKTILVNVEKSVAEKRSDLNELILSDKEPPLPFTIEFGRDLALYDGQYFVSFYTKDSGSGIRYYEVSEKGFPTVRSGSPYVLRDQSLRSNIEIKAVDFSGNSRTEKFSPPSKSQNKVAVILISSLIVLGVIIITFKKKAFTKR
ncbi:MAG: hypothetical protein KBC17_02140 [Candidatus Pacebacteria bacterium]|nr:hypothetical protein [Candidatus Paceibacterota bacterium]